MVLNDLTLNSLKGFTRGKAFVGSWNYANVEIPFEIAPRKFLAFAESDYKGKYSRQLVNALSNMKRALECQLDTMLYALGLSHRSEKEQWSFRKKAEMLSYLGILAPDVLKRINKRRNLLEHEYRAPEQAEVEDGLDIARLFIEYTDTFLGNMYSRCQLEHTTLKDWVDVAFDWENCKITLELFKPIPHNRSKNHLALGKEVTAISSEYAEYLKWFVSLSKMPRRKMIMV
jgi:hypothetical protein